MALLRTATSSDLGPVIQSRSSGAAHAANVRLSGLGRASRRKPRVPHALGAALGRRRALPCLVPPPRPPLSARPSRGHGLCAVHLRAHASGALVGGLTLCNVRRGVTQACTLGYWIGAPHAQQGYMTAAVRAVVPFVFDSLELHRLEAACLPDQCGLDQASGEDRLHARGDGAPLSEDQRRVAGPSALRAA